MKRQKLGEGNTAEIFQYEPEKILKLFRKGIPESLSNTEWENTALMAQIFPFVPKVYGKLSRNGRYGIVYEQLFGKDMLVKMLLCFWKQGKYAREFAGVHAKIHQKRYRKEEVNFSVASLKEKISNDIEAADELSSREKKHWIGELKKLPDGNQFCHMDYHPGNVIVEKKGPVVIDWMTLAIGDAAADVARTRLLLRDAVVPMKSALVKKIFHRFQKKIACIYVEEYQRLTGMETDRIDVWEKVLCAARLREWIPEEEKKLLLGKIRVS